jgi:hypothetical protein
MNAYVWCNVFFVQTNIKFLFQNKIEGNFEIWVCNNVNSIYLIYYFFVNQMFIYNKLSNSA